MEIKIAINARFLTQRLTGVQRFAAEICKQIREKRPDIVFLTPSNIVNQDLAQQLGAIVVGKNTGARWEQIDLILYLKKNGKPLLLSLCNAAPLFYNNQIVTIHDLAFMENPKWFSNAFAIFYNFLIPRIAKFSRKIITVSNFSKTQIIKHLNVEETKVSVVYNSVSDLPQSDSFKNIFGKYVLVVGSIDKRKNIDILINAFCKINIKDIKLLIVGDVNQIFKTSTFQNLNSNVIILGYVSDETLSGLYANASLFVYPSLYEGFGIPPIEAMYYGCPTIVSDIGSLTEICGDASLYIDPLDERDITEKIKFMLSNDKVAQKLIEAGKKNIKRFSWEQSADEILTIVAKLS